MSSPANRQEEILAAAGRIFQRKGYHGTSVRDIADAVGLLKGSLYHYIRSKEELLARLFEGLLEDTVGELEAIARRDAGAADRLRDMVRAYARAIIANQGAVGLYLRDWRSLPVRELAGLAARRRRMRTLFSGVIADGARAGELAPGDPNVATLAILGMCNWMYEWYRPDGRLTRDAVIDELAERAVRSVRP
ncbi:MAG TPA: TetR/AcrR family transcriptional regulator [Candidatus Limnocylindria bacterium]|nr:TetR/AcrR family transcriptional regulator [Candidatus Limnocylindria bacterium]